jgi:hypothetical protein
MKVIEGVKLPVKLGEAVETVQRGDDGVFTIKSTVATYRARTVVLATGLRGKPRLLAVPGANLEKVQSLLDDPVEFAGESVLVVGGGDSAVEGAMALAEAGATVTLSYRGDGFKRCKQTNQKRLAELVAARRLDVLLGSNVTCFTADGVTITLADRSAVKLANQRAFVLIGADTPVAWLEANQVRFVERPHLYALGSSEDVVRRFAPDAAECPHTADGALALLLDLPVSRSSAHRVRSAVEHLRDEFREVVTSVSAAFRLSDLEPPPDRRRAMARGAGANRMGSKVVPTQAGANQRARPDDRLRDTARARDEEIRQIRALRALPQARAPVSGSARADDCTTEQMPSLRTLERAAEADRLSARAFDDAFDHAFDAEALTLHSLERTVVDASTPEAACSAPTSGARPAAPQVRPRDPTPPRSSVPPPPPRPPRLAHGSEGGANPPATLSEPNRALTGRHEGPTAAGGAPWAARPDAATPSLPRRPSRLPRGSAVVPHRLTPTPTLLRREPLSTAAIEAVPPDRRGPETRSRRGPR